jgi:hypothetical protein
MSDTLTLATQKKQALVDAKIFEQSHVQRTEQERMRVRQGIIEFEQALTKVPGAVLGDSMPLRHSFADGCYVREILVPKNTLVVGKIHKHSHPRFLLRGEALVFTEHTGWRYFRAPSYVISQSGRKSIFFALEDTIVVTVHVTDETDLEKIEDFVIAKTYDDYETFKKEQLALMEPAI